MMPARSLLLANYTMGSLTCGLGGNSHTPSHAGCRVHPITPGAALRLGQNVLHCLFQCGGASSNSRAVCKDIYVTIITKIDLI